MTRGGNYAFSIIIKNNVSIIGAEVNTILEGRCQRPADKTGLHPAEASPLV